MDTQQIQSLWANTQTSLAGFQKDQSETCRKEALAQITKLQRALEQPKDAILKLSYQPMVFMALKVAHDMKVFPVLANATAPVSAKQLAAAKPANPLLVERIMRLLVSFDIVVEPEPSAYLPTAIAKEMVNRPAIGTMESLFCEFLPILQKTPGYLAATNYQNPEDPLRAPLQYTHNVETDGFSWLCDHPAALTRFNDFMEGQRANRVHWGDWFPVQERVLAGADSNPERALVVDIGGGRGHDLMLFQKRFPDAPGKLVLEDLPSVIDEAASDLNACGIQGVKYDFFKEANPVKGARVYYFKFVFHDWSDEKARILLSHVVDAMEAGYSKLVIEEYILPDRNAEFLHGTTDMAVMIFCSGLERTRQQWKSLLESVGLQPTFWTRENDGLGVIESVLPVANGANGTNGTNGAGH
ncbi:S-adenosyl-L-methionine-dependent methyltransferase [Aspergillus taichungensis]|uniref:S-adenosyl-L-methionine-dependent methyltransferase n=1 Tax=Aspergillus taichungensis TaxID=482145 RepID=A0A2J5HGS5_9EURO|nr:S-adenosyl-L-methionine-dependent methyltransferase [Aspergillus taichungensis]